MCSEMPSIGRRYSGSYKEGFHCIYRIGSVCSISVAI